MNIAICDDNETDKPSFSYSVLGREIKVLGVDSFLIFDMAGKDCRYGAYVELDFVNNTPIFSEKYVYIDKIGFPHDTDSPPLNYKFENLNKHIETIENTEQYHSKIKHGYKKYKICNYYNIFKNLFLHPFNGIDIIYAAIKRIINNFFH